MPPVITLASATDNPARRRADHKVLSNRTGPGVIRLQRAAGCRSKSPQGPARATGGGAGRIDVRQISGADPEAAIDRDRLPSVGAWNSEAALPPLQDPT